MKRYFDQFSVIRRTPDSSLSIQVLLYCMIQFIFQRRNGTISYLQMMLICMRRLFSPIESGFRDKGKVSTIAGHTANYDNGLLFLCSLPLEWKWFWMISSSQFLRQISWCFCRIFRVQWVFDPGIDLDAFRCRMCSGLTDKVSYSGIHDFTLQNCRLAATKVYPWTPHSKWHKVPLQMVRIWVSKIQVSSGVTDEQKVFKEKLYLKHRVLGSKERNNVPLGSHRKKIEVSYDPNTECLVLDGGKTELLEALGLIMRCANRSLIQEKLTTHKFRIRTRSSTKKEKNRFNNLFASQALIDRASCNFTSLYYHLQHMAHKLLM